MKYTDLRLSLPHLLVHGVWHRDRSPRNTLHYGCYVLLMRNRASLSWRRWCVGLEVHPHFVAGVLINAGRVELYAGWLTLRFIHWRRGVLYTEP